jgi:DNA-binding NarL/FixJ family response regulator
MGQFTGRQLQVIDCLCKGESNEAIARKLDMAECTVKGRWCTDRLLVWV